MKNKYFAQATLVLLIISTLSIHGQSDEYYPKGDPDAWNVELTPFVWLPSIRGEFSSERLSGESDIPAADLISNLEMAFMITAEISKGKFFIAPTYIYTKLGMEEVLWSDDGGENDIVLKPEMKMNIFELIAGARFRVNKFFIVDPFAGFRYTSYNIYGSVEGINTNSFDEDADFWDPVIGIQMSYFPHPRVPIIFKTDIGGFGAGSQFSWTVSINSGYTISPSIDLLTGFAAYGTDFEKKNALGNNIGLDMTMYGFDLGMKYHIPKRIKDKSVFKRTE
jgi:hypothetical protein